MFLLLFFTDTWYFRGCLSGMFMHAMSADECKVQTDLYVCDL